MLGRQRLGIDAQDFSEGRLGPGRIATPIQEPGLAVEHLSRPVRWVLYMVFALLIVILGRTDTVPFVYFQF